jgi:uncharacterized protein YjiS (DUF1127 family)
MSGTLVAGTRPHALPRRMAAARDALRALLRHLNAWHQRQRRAAADREALINMSDRELADIGIPRGSVQAAADRTWLRDCPS